MLLAHKSRKRVNEDRIQSGDCKSLTRRYGASWTLEQDDDEHPYEKRKIFLKKAEKYIPLIVEVRTTECMEAIVAGSPV